MNPIATAPKDRDILVYYDHAADPYNADEHGRLTPYGTWCESGGFLPDKGFCIAKWQDQTWESVDEYGAGYWLPGWWFVKHDDEYECACNPTHWTDLPAPPEPTE